MNDKFPPEAEGCNLDDDFKLVEDFVPTRRDLEVLARHYLDDVWKRGYWQMAYGTTCSDLVKDYEFAKRRLGSIVQILGTDALDKIIAQEQEKWIKMGDDVKVELATPVDCEECGEEFLREFLDQVVCEESMRKYWSVRNAETPRDGGNTAKAPALP